MIFAKSRTHRAAELFPVPQVPVHAIVCELLGALVLPNVRQRTCLGISRNSLMEASMRSTIIFHIIASACLLFISTAACAQSPADDLGPLPTTPSEQQLESLSQLAPAPLDTPQQTHARRRLPIPVIPLTPEEVGYRDAVRALGTDSHRFVRCQLADGKVRTGAIVRIEADGFYLRDGIIGSSLIPYSRLTASPVRVAAVGTHTLNALKWTGFVAGCAAIAPIAIALYPLVLAGVVTD